MMSNAQDDLTDKEKMEFVFNIHEDDALIEPWDRNVAESLAKKEGVDLTEEHWNVVSFLRKFYKSVGQIDYARDLSAMLDQKYKDKGGLKYLFTLFPHGPVTQGCKIAGVPVPKDSTDSSFGSVA